VREDYTPEQRAIIVRCRARFAYIDSLAEPQRSLAIVGAPESQWPALLHWISETVELIRKDRTSRPGPSH
jgi:hypothetical protein